MDLPLTLEMLNHQFGVKRLLLEGGGVTNGAFLRAGLVDELSLVICPVVDGSAGAPRVFDSGLADAGHAAPLRSMKLESSRTLAAGCVWLRYHLGGA